MKKKSQLKTLESIAKKLRLVAAEAESIEFTLANGAYLDCLVSSMADEVDTLVQLARYNEETKGRP